MNGHIQTDSEAWAVKSIYGKVFGFVAFLTCLGFALSCQAQPTVFGTLASSPMRAGLIAATPIKVVTYGISWSSLEPQQGVVDAAYVQKVQDDLAAFRAAGLKISLDPGMQYPPAWAYAMPNASFVNQYGDVFVHTTGPGTNGLNAVYHQAIRDLQAAHLSHLFANFGTDFYAFRLGWGYYGELNYPHPDHLGKKNCYWAFDPIAQGKEQGLAQGVLACPVSGWVPGMPSTDHVKARQFIHWYLNALQNYHNWQITQVRKHYAGDLVMLMGSWGLRDGDVDGSIQKDLADDGRTEIQRGFDFGKYIAGVNDPKYVVCCTWLDTPAAFCDDASANPLRWSPVHDLAFHAQKHPLKFRVWGENTGKGNVQAMTLSFQRARAFGLQAIIWAFEDDLFDNQHAQLSDYLGLIAQYDK